MSSPLSTALASARRRAGALTLATASVLLALAFAPSGRVPSTASAASTQPAATAAAAGTPSGAATQSTTTPPKAPGAATLQQCLTSPEQAERSATFSGEMTAIPGTVKMEMRIDVLERMPHESAYHAVVAPGLGVWRTAAPGVRVYRYLRQVTNLSAPASYRAAVRFRWVGAKDKTIRALELRTPRCLQTVSAEQPSPEEVSAAG